MKLSIPVEVGEAISRLEAEGFETWLVGGVRDLCLGRTPHDWDLTTAARPEDIKRVFGDLSQNLSGERFGTVGIHLNAVPMDITTFRREGGYSDHRHPGEVVFTTNLFEDLKRRDFTVNAMVYHPERGLKDFFCGKRDLKKRLIRAIGDADARFHQDAVRILRALRFSAVLGFDIEEKTAAALHRCKDLLLAIAPERILPEFTRMLCGRNVRYVLTEFSDVIGVIIPEILPAVGFSQHSPFHQYDVWQHTVHALAFADSDPIVRLSLLFHDISKPGCLTMDTTGRGHFYAHPRKSSVMAREIMERMKFPTKTVDTVTKLVALHDSHPASRGDIKILLGEVGEKLFPSLIRVMEADTLAHSRWSIKKRLAHVRELEATARDILTNGECYDLKGLAIDGRDLEAAGVRGARIGELLQLALQKVVRGQWENKRENLLSELAKNNW